MIIWQKLGILGILIPFGLGIMSQLLFGETPIYAGAGYLLSALPVWYLGKKWNTSEKNTTTKHTLFWIHLEYWGVLAGLVGLMIIISETILELGTDTYFVIFGIGLAFILVHQYSKSRSSIKDIFYKLAPIKIVEPNDLLQSKKTDNRLLEENTLLSSGIKTEKKEVTNLNNKLKESHEAIDGFMNTKEQLKDFEPSDHSRFMPSNSSNEIRDGLEMNKMNNAEKEELNQHIEE